MKNERGFGILEMLIVLAVFLLITAMVGISAQSLIQGQNESNAKSGVSALALAENSYNSSFNGYVTGSNLHELSDCPAPALVAGKMVVTPTKTAACENISAAYTNSLTAYHYNFSVSSTVGPDGVAGTADDGYLITASPVNAPSGRLTLCESNTDGLLRGKVSGATPTDAASCNAFNVIASGPTSTPSTQSNLPVTVMAVGGKTMLATLVGNYYQAGSTVTLDSLTLPPTEGKFLVSAQIFSSVLPSGISSVMTAVPCSILDGSGSVLSTGQIMATSGTLVSHGGVSLAATVNYPAGTTLTLQCTGATNSAGTFGLTAPLPNQIESSSLTAVQSQ